MFTLQVNYPPAILDCPLLPHELSGPIHPSQVDHQRAAQHLDHASLPLDSVALEHPLNRCRTPISCHVHHDRAPSTASACSQRAHNTGLKVWSVERYLSSFACCNRVAREPVDFHAIAHDVANPSERHPLSAVNCASTSSRTARLQSALMQSTT
jgi:hypothetical protein